MKRLAASLAPLGRVVRLWRDRGPWLALGLAVAAASAGSGVALLALAGAHVAVLLLGTVAAGAGLLAALGPLRVVLRYAERMTTHSATFRALADLRGWFFRALARRSAGGLGMARSGDMAARLVDDIDSLDGLYLRIIVPFACAALLLPVLVVALVEHGGALWPAGLVACVFFALAVFVVPAVSAVSANRLGAALTAATASLRVTVLDALSALREVRVSGAEARVLQQVTAGDAAARTAQRRVGGQAALGQAAGFLCAQAAVLAILLGAGARPVFAAGAVFLLVAAFEVAGGLPRAGALTGHAQAAARRVLDAASPGTSVPEPIRPVPLPSGTSLRLAGVHFRWAPDRPQLFNGLTLEIPQGSRVAILGPSGSGKSTIAALLLKLAVPEEGHIEIDGVDIATLTSGDVRSRIGFLSQATHLFDDTIRANLLLARPGANDAALWRALDEAEIGDFVRGLPDGLDTWLGEAGARVSGGQGRRIVLARTLLSDAPILVLDEPCSGLDGQTERQFLSTLGGVAQGRTVVLIAHRLTGVEQLDRIWRLSAGRSIAAAA